MMMTGVCGGVRAPFCACCTGLGSVRDILISLFSMRVQHSDEDSSDSDDSSDSSDSEGRKGEDTKAETFEKRLNLLAFDVFSQFMRNLYEVRRA